MEETEEGIRQLTIREVFPDDEGKYTCLVKNEFGKVTSSTHMIVESSIFEEVIEEKFESKIAEEKPKPKISPVQEVAQEITTQIMETVEKQLKQEMQTETVQEFWAVREVHDVIIKPEELPRGRELVAETPVFDSKPIQTIPVPRPESAAQKVIEPFKPSVAKKQQPEVLEHAAFTREYKVVEQRENIIQTQTAEGYFYREIHFHIEAKEKPEVSGSAPEFVRQLHNVTVTEGESVKLKCIVTGHPAPDVRWFVDGDQIVPSKDFQIVYEDGISMLEIDEVFPEDEGEYVCEAVNEYGRTTTKCYLKVFHLPSRSETYEKSEVVVSEQIVQKRVEETKLSEELIAVNVEVYKPADHFEHIVRILFTDQAKAIARLFAPVTSYRVQEETEIQREEVERQVFQPKRIFIEEHREVQRFEEIIHLEERKKVREQREVIQRKEQPVYIKPLSEVNITVEVNVIQPEQAVDIKIIVIDTPVIQLTCTVKAPRVTKHIVEHEETLIVHKEEIEIYPFKPEEKHVPKPEELFTKPLPSFTPELYHIKSMEVERKETGIYDIIKPVVRYAALSETRADVNVFITKPADEFQHIVHVYCTDFAAGYAQLIAPRRVVSVDTEEMMIIEKTEFEIKPLQPKQVVSEQIFVQTSEMRKEESTVEQLETKRVVKEAFAIPQVQYQPRIERAHIQEEVIEVIVDVIKPTELFEHKVMISHPQLVQIYRMIEKQPSFAQTIVTEETSIVETREIETKPKPKEVTFMEEKFVEELETKAVEEKRVVHEEIRKSEEIVNVVIDVVKPGDWLENIVTISQPVKSVARFHTKKSKTVHTVVEESFAEVTQEELEIRGIHAEEEYIVQPVQEVSHFEKKVDKLESVTTIEKGIETVIAEKEMHPWVQFKELHEESVRVDVYIMKPEEIFEHTVRIMLVDKISATANVRSVKTSKVTTHEEIVIVESEEIALVPVQVQERKLEEKTYSTHELLTEVVEKQKLTTETISSKIVEQYKEIRQPQVSISEFSETATNVIVEVVKSHEKFDTIVNIAYPIFDRTFLQTIASRAITMTKEEMLEVVQKDKYVIEQAEEKVETIVSIMKQEEHMEYIVKLSTSPREEVQILVVPIGQKQTIVIEEVLITEKQEFHIEPQLPKETFVEEKITETTELKEEQKYEQHLQASFTETEDLMTYREGYKPKVELLQFEETEVGVVVDVYKPADYFEVLVKISQTPHEQATLTTVSLQQRQTLVTEEVLITERQEFKIEPQLSKETFIEEKIIETTELKEEKKFEEHLQFSYTEAEEMITSKEEYKPKVEVLQFEETEISVVVEIIKPADHYELLVKLSHPQTARAQLATQVLKTITITKEEFLEVIQKEKEVIEVQEEETHIVVSIIKQEEHMEHVVKMLTSLEEKAELKTISLTQKQMVVTEESLITESREYEIQPQVPKETHIEEKLIETTEMKEVTKREEHLQVSFVEEGEITKYKEEYQPKVELLKFEENEVGVIVDIYKPAEIFETIVKFLYPTIDKTRLVVQKMKAITVVTEELIEITQKDQKLVEMAEEETSVFVNIIKQGEDLEYIAKMSMPVEEQSVMQLRGLTQRKTITTEETVITEVQEYKVEPLLPEEVVLEEKVSETTEFKESKKIEEYLQVSSIEAQELLIPKEERIPKVEVMQFEETEFGVIVDICKPADRFETIVKFMLPVTAEAEHKVIQQKSVQITKEEFIEIVQKEIIVAAGEEMTTIDVTINKREEESNFIVKFIETLTEQTQTMLKPTIKAEKVVTEETTIIETKEIEIKPLLPEKETVDEEFHSVQEFFEEVKKTHIETAIIEQQLLQSYEEHKPTTKISKFEEAEFEVVVEITNPSQQFETIVNIAYPERAVAKSIISLAKKVQIIKEEFLEIVQKEREVTEVSEEEEAVTVFLQKDEEVANFIVKLSRSPEEKADISVVRKGKEITVEEIIITETQEVVDRREKIAEITEADVVCAVSVSKEQETSDSVVNVVRSQNDFSLLEVKHFKQQETIITEELLVIESQEIEVHAQMPEEKEIIEETFALSNLQETQETMQQLRSTMIESQELETYIERVQPVTKVSKFEETEVDIFVEVTKPSELFQTVVSMVYPEMEENVLTLTERVTVTKEVAEVIEEKVLEIVRHETKLNEEEIFVEVSVVKPKELFDSLVSFSSSEDEKTTLFTRQIQKVEITREEFIEIHEKEEIITESVVSELQESESTMEVSIRKQSERFDQMIKFIYPEVIKVEMKAMVIPKEEEFLVAEVVTEKPSSSYGTTVSISAPSYVTAAVTFYAVEIRKEQLTEEQWIEITKQEIIELAEELEESDVTIFKPEQRLEAVARLLITDLISLSSLITVTKKPLEELTMEYNFKHKTSDYETSVQAYTEIFEKAESTVKMQLIKTVEIVKEEVFEIVKTEVIVEEQQITSEIFIERKDESYETTVVFNTVEMESSTSEVQTTKMLVEEEVVVITKEEIVETESFVESLCDIDMFKSTETFATTANLIVWELDQCKQNIYKMKLGEEQVQADLVAQQSAVQSDAQVTFAEKVISTCQLFTKTQVVVEKVETWEVETKEIVETEKMISIEIDIFKPTQIFDSTVNIVYSEMEEVQQQAKQFVGKQLIQEEVVEVTKEELVTVEALSSDINIQKQQEESSLIVNLTHIEKERTKQWLHVSKLEEQSVAIDVMESKTLEASTSDISIAKLPTEECKTTVHAEKVVTATEEEEVIVKKEEIIVTEQETTLEVNLVKPIGTFECLVNFLVPDIIQQKQFIYEHKKSEQFIISEVLIANIEEKLETSKDVLMQSHETSTTQMLVKEELLEITETEKVIIEHLEETSLFVEITKPSETFEFTVNFLVPESDHIKLICHERKLGEEFIDIYISLENKPYISDAGILFAISPLDKAHLLIKLTKGELVHEEILEIEKKEIILSTVSDIDIGKQIELFDTTVTFETHEEEQIQQIIYQDKLAEEQINADIIFAKQPEQGLHDLVLKEQTVEEQHQSVYERTVSEEMVIMDLTVHKPEAKISGTITITGPVLEHATLRMQQWKEVSVVKEEIVEIKKEEVIGAEELSMISEISKSSDSFHSAITFSISEAAQMKQTTYEHKAGEENIIFDLSLERPSELYKTDVIFIAPVQESCMLQQITHIKEEIIEIEKKEIISTSETILVATIEQKPSDEQLTVMVGLKEKEQLLGKVNLKAIPKTIAAVVMEEVVSITETTSFIAVEEKVTAPIAIVTHPERQTEVTETRVTEIKEEEVSVSVSVSESELAVQAPVFVQTIKEQIVVEGEGVKFKAIVVGFPIPTVNWLVDGDKIVSSK